MVRFFFAFGVEAGLVLLLFLNIIPPLELYGRLLHGLWLVLLLFSLLCQAYWVRSLRRGAARNIGVVVATLGVIVGGVCFGEALFRIFPIYDAYDYNPGIKFFWPDRVYGKLNNFGHCDRDFSSTKPEKTYRILVAGDSFVEGSGVRRGQTFSRVLESELNAELDGSGRRVEVYNLGHCGMNTVEEVALLRTQVPQLNPDMLILAYVYNDPEINPKPSYIPPGKDDAVSFLSFLDAVNVEAGKADSGAGDALRNNQQMSYGKRVFNFAITKLHSYMAYFVYKYSTYFSMTRSLSDDIKMLHSDANPGWAQAKAALKDLSEYARSREMELVGIVFPVFIDPPYPQPIGEALRKVSAYMQDSGFTEAIDLAPLYDSSKKSSGLGEFALSHFDSHPNVNAHALLGKNLAETLQRHGTLKSFMAGVSPAQGN
jgi:hypothetical protein